MHIHHSKYQAVYCTATHFCMEEVKESTSTADRLTSKYGKLHCQKYSQKCCFIHSKTSLFWNEKKKNTKWFLLFLSYSQALTEMCLAWKSQKSFLGPACCNWELYFKQMPPATAEPEGEAATPATCGNSKGGMIHLWCRRKVCMCQLGKMQRSLMICEFVGLAWFQWCRGCTWRYLGTGWQGSDKHLLD